MKWFLKIYDYYNIYLYYFYIIMMILINHRQINNWNELLKFKISKYHIYEAWLNMIFYKIAIIYIYFFPFYFKKASQL